MDQSQQITAALKQFLKEKRITYAMLAQKIRLSEASVKRMFSTSAFTLKRLAQICAVLELDIFTLAKMAQSTSEKLDELSLAQEKTLAQDIKLLTLFHLLLHEWRFKDICAEFAITDAEGIKLLAKLDRLKLIELMPNNRVCMICPQRFNWRADGPVRQKYQSAGVTEYLAGNFSPATDLLRLEVRELSAASMAIVKRKLERVAVEFNELAEIDSSLPIAQRASIGMVLAIRPWVFSVVSALKRK